MPIRTYALWRRLLHALARIGPCDYTTAAHAAGCCVVAIPNTYLQSAEVAQDKAHYVYKTLSDAHFHMRQSMAPEAQNI